MEFDSFAATLLVLSDDPPVLDKTASDALQNAHLDYLATLHEEGHLLAAGPLDHDGFRGLMILRGSVEEVRALTEADPAVRSGRFRVVVTTWRVPAGAVHFTPTRFPHSIADVVGG